MLLLFLLTVIDAVADQHTFILALRVRIGPFPLNIIDAFMILGMLSVLARGLGARNSAYFVVDRQPRIVTVILAIFMLSLMFGLVMGGMNGILNASVYAFLDDVRDFLAMPVSFCIGYFLLKQPKSVWWLLSAYVIAGFAVAGMVLVFFGNKAGEGKALHNIDAARALDYCDIYAGIVGPMLIFCGLAGVQIFRRTFWGLFPTLTAFALGIFCMVGQFATVNRSSWVSTTAALIAIVLALPPSKRLRGSALVLVVFPTLAFVCIYGVNLLAKATQSDLATKIEAKLQSLNPNTDEKIGWAGNSRMPGIQRELALWLQSPLIGGGFGIDEVDNLQHYEVASYHHCPWTNYLSETGLLGFSNMVLLLFGTVFTGWQMIRARMDRVTMAMGALGVSTGVFAICIAASTLSINHLRYAVPVGVVCGAVFRTRAMQLTTLRMWRDYLPEHPDPNGMMADDLDAVWAGPIAQ